jgi:sulfur-oxidizing protein SoxA
MQADDLSNPGFLWVESGEKLWNTPAGAANQSCASCHGDARSSMRGVAAQYPKQDATANAVQTWNARSKTPAVCASRSRATCARCSRRPAHRVTA